MDQDKQSHSENTYDYEMKLLVREVVFVAVVPRKDLLVYCGDYLDEFIQNRSHKYSP